LQDQQNSLEAKVAKLEEELTKLSNSLKHPSKDPQNSNEIQNQQNSLDKRLKHLESKITTETAQTSQSTSNEPKSVISTLDRKFNIIAYGIPESPPKTDKRSRQKMTWKLYSSLW